MAAQPAPAMLTGSVINLRVAELAVYVAGVLSVAAGVMHLWAAPHHLAEWWGYGAFFLAAAVAQGFFGLALLRWPVRRLALLGIYGNLALVSLYAVTRTTGVPFFGPHAGHPEAVGALDLAAVSTELVLILALIPLSGASRTLLSYLASGIVQALGVGLVLHLLHTGTHQAHDGFAQGWMIGSLSALPLSLLVLMVATPLARRVSAHLYGEDPGTSARLLWALASAAAYAGAHVFASGPGSFGEAGRDGGVVLGVSLVLLFTVAAISGTPWENRSFDLRRPRTLAALTGILAGLAVLAGPTFFGPPSSAEAQQAAGECNAQNANRSYDVAAINVEIPFNRWGDLDPDGQAYVLQGDKEAVKNWHVKLGRNADGTLNPATDPAGAENRRLRPRPLIIRANVGECVRVDFTNELNDRQWGGRLMNPRASIQARGVSYNAQTSDGGAVGFNDDTSVPNTPGQNKISYFWRVPNEEGMHLFRSQTMSTGEEEDAGSNAHGLYGAIAVEPAGSTWTDPETGKPMYAGEGSIDRVTKDHGDPYVDADIHPAGAPSFRESAQLAQDYNEVQPGMVGHGFNYGTEPQRNREKAENLPPDGTGEEVSLSSWGYGDPALIKLASGKGPWLPKDAQGNLVTDTERVEDCGLQTRLDGKGSCYVSNVNHAYANDPTKIRYAMAGVAETHVFHLHANQWLANPKDTATFTPNDPGSATLDSQTFGPGESFTADLLYGAGSKPGTVGDSIFHCHLYPHFAEGFWSLMRVHDVKEDGTGKLPDGTKVREVKPLPDRTAPVGPSADNPGYPRFIPGEYGWRAPQAPDSIFETRQDDPNTPANESKDDPKTVEREDLSPATRIVAGKVIPEAKLALEKGVQKLNYGAETPKPGAPLTDPCKPGPGETKPREVTYNVSVMQRDVVYNEAGWHDTQGRFLVLNEDVPKMLERNADGSYKHQPEPLFARVAAGDCINFNLTNLLPNFFGDDAFQQLVQTNMMGQHIHLVKFDVLGSDGSTNGWNYQQAAFTEKQAEFNKELLAGTKTCTNTSKGCQLPLPTKGTWNAAWDKGAEPGQTISERWYADYELRTVFSHDHHFAAIDQNRGQFAGLLVEPKGMDFRNPKKVEGAEKYYQPGNGSIAGAPTCGTACNGNAVGTAMDVIGPGAKDDFREFGLAVQDFVSLTRKDGDPRNRADVFVGPNAPEHYPDEDPGIVGVNYRNAPFKLREEKNGQKVDPAYRFSSSVFGDPATPLLEAYAEDPVQIRLIQGSQEHQHAFAVNGMRWREDSEDPESPFVGTQDIGISEAFNMKVPKMECGAGDATCAGDYLYSSTNLDDLYMGMWGILRARGKQVPSLLPLPDNATPSQATDATAPTTTLPQNEGAPLSTASGALAPPEANSPGTPCAPGAPSRQYNVVAMEANIKYNKQGDHDPYGLIYALAEDEAAIRAGTKKPEPLTIRANEGDCVEVRLTNKLTPKFLEHKGAADGDAMPPLEPMTGTPAGLRVSLHPQTVQFDVRGSDGTAVGYNRDQTVGPGESKLYRWYADDVNPGEIGATNLTDFGDVRGHRHHGLFGGLNIEPKGSTYHDPKTGQEIKSGQSADIRVPDGKDFREFTTFFQDGLNLRDSSGAHIQNVPDPAVPHVEESGAPAEGPEAPGAEAHDHIDQGEKGFNYGSTPFRHRLGGREAAFATDTSPLDGQQLANVYSSKANGDPDTPVFRAFAGDPVRMRVLQGADKQRQHTFEVLGHAWHQYPGDGSSTLVSAQGGFSLGRALNIQLPSAGNGFAGDYRYADAMYRHNLSGGLWGLMRVYPKPVSDALTPNPLRDVDDPRAAGNHPILPLEPPPAPKPPAPQPPPPPAANAAPVARADSYSVKEDKLLRGATVLRNDTDANGDPLTAQVVKRPTKGKLTPKPNGTFTYKPKANFYGTDSFTYKASDGKRSSNVVKVTIKVKAQPN